LRRSWRIFFAFVLAQAGQKVLKVAPARVLPVKLHLLAQHQSSRFAGRPVSIVAKQDVQRGQGFGFAPADQRVQQCGAVGLAARQKPRAGYRREG